METIRLYQIPFSHYCDKVRWALDYYSLPYETINYTGPKTTPGLKKAPKTLQKLTPIIEDPNNENFFISDSTPILLYLDKQYGKEKTLFPLNINDEIIQYCLKLDSQLGLYVRRLAYLHIIYEKPALLSVFVNGKYDKISYDDWKSYFVGLIGSSIVIGRLGIDRIEEENIFEKTISILDEITKDLQGKEYLFNNQFTAADLTLTSLIRPLKYVTPLFIKYKTIFEYSDKIRQRHDPKPSHQSNGDRLFTLHRQQKPTKSIIGNFISKIFYFIFYPLRFIFKDKPLLQYPSMNTNEKANNDVRILRLNSIINSLRILIKNFYHLCFTIPKQIEFVNNQGKKILQQQNLHFDFCQ